MKTLIQLIADITGCIKDGQRENRDLQQQNLTFQNQTIGEKNIIKDNKLSEPYKSTFARTFI